MTTDNANRFIAAFEILAPSDGSGLRILRQRGRSSAVIDLTVRDEWGVRIKSIIGLEGSRSGRGHALGSACYFADVFDVCLEAHPDVILRDVGGEAVPPEWLKAFGFLQTREGDFVRLPRSLMVLGTQNVVPC